MPFTKAQRITFYDGDFTRKGSMVSGIPCKDGYYQVIADKRYAWETPDDLQYYLLADVIQ